MYVGCGAEGRKANTRSRRGRGGVVVVGREVLRGWLCGRQNMRWSVAEPTRRHSLSSVFFLMNLTRWITMSNQTAPAALELTQVLCEC